MGYDPLPQVFKAAKISLLTVEIIIITMLIVTPFIMNQVRLWDLNLEWTSPMNNYLTYFCFGRSTVDDLWEMAAAKIAPVLLTCTQSVTYKLRINYFNYKVLSYLWNKATAFFKVECGSKVNSLGINQDTNLSSKNNDIIWWIFSSFISLPLK